MFPQKAFKISEIPVRLGSGESATVERYCVKQTYVSVDHSGQVLLIDDGVFCLVESESGEGEYSFTSCKGVKRKKLEQKNDKNT